MKFGVIGLGGIAQKAYLPTYAKIRDRGEFVFATRNKDTQKQIQGMYGFPKMVGTIDELLEEGIDACFIHVATQAHYATAKACLERGVHVFMDKPVSERITEITELQQLAQKNHCVFMVGFNRRFAPMVGEIKELKDKRVIQLQKNCNSDQRYLHATRFAIYDLFIHIIDTAVYLLEDEIRLVESKIVEKADNIELAYLHLETPTTTALLSMDFNSGANTEIYQASSREKTVFLHDLMELEIFTESGKEVRYFGGWEGALYKRGFEQMVDQFISACHTGDTSQLRQKNVLLSHQLCEEMLKRKN